MLAVVVAVLAILVYYIYLNFAKIQQFWILHQRAWDLFEDIPGPPSIPLLGCTHTFKLSNEEFTYQLEEWSIKYLSAPVPRTGVVKAWIGPVPIVILGTADAVKPVLESPDLIAKPSQYDTLSQWIGEGLLTSTNKKWHSRRKMLTPVFHFNVLQAYYEIFGRHAQTLVDVIDKYADNNETFDMFPYLKRCALDVICETAMGTQINCQIGENAEYVNAVVRLGQLVWNHERFPWLWLRPIWYLTGIGYEFDKNVKIANDFTKKVIADRRRELEAEGFLNKLNDLTEEDIRKNKLSFLDLLITMQQRDGLSDEDIREEVDTFMFEGHDTTSAGVGFTLWWLGQYPRCQKLVHDELDMVFGSSSRLPTADDLRQLIYLEKCVKEAQRLTPSVPLIARKLAHDVKIAHFTIPKDCTVVISPMSVHRDERVWLAPAEFRPEHFDAEEIAKRDPYAYIPFSAGPRNCIGQKFAIYEEKSILATVLRRYRVETMQPGNENRAVPELILKPAHGFKFRLHRREAQPA